MYRYLYSDALVFLTLITAEFKLLGSQREVHHTHLNVKFSIQKYVLRL